MTTAFLIRPEHDDDRDAIGELHRRAFGEEVVATLAGALRDAPAPLPPIGLVAESGQGSGGVVGHVLLSASRLDAPSSLVDVLVLSPLGVLPGFQRQGVGTALVRAALDAAEAVGVPLVFLEGSPDYYGSRGFERADALGFRAPSLRIPPPGFQVARLATYQAWMTGTLVYSETFWALDCVGLREGDPRLGA